jgi:protein tyrosine/serine phosphatase
MFKDDGTNFREIHMGAITKGILYRSDYPVLLLDKERDKKFNQLAVDAGIACVLNLADNENEIWDIAEFVPWYDELLKLGCVAGLGISFEFDFTKKQELKIFEHKLQDMFTFIISHNGPYLIHCSLGKDRTGFAAALIEAFSGATLNEVIFDYLLSYTKIPIEEVSNVEYADISAIILRQLTSINNGKIVTDSNLQTMAETYLTQKIGLTGKDIAILRHKFSDLSLCDRDSML